MKFKSCSVAPKIKRRKRLVDDDSFEESSESRPTTTTESATPEVKEIYKLSVQHYVVFKTSIKNQTRVEASKF